MKNGLITTHTHTHDDGTQKWYLNGELHREDGPAIIYPDASQAWYVNGKRHRVDGPAIIYLNGTQHWYLNGEMHREDGPAIIQYWYVNGKQILKKEIEEWQEQYNIPTDFEKWNKKHKMLFKLRWL